MSPDATRIFVSYRGPGPCRDAPPRTSSASTAILNRARVRNPVSSARGSQRVRSSRGVVRHRCHRRHHPRRPLHLHQPPGCPQRSPGGSHIVDEDHIHPRQGPPADAATHPHPLPPRTTAIGSCHSSLRMAVPLREHGVDIHLQRPTGCVRQLPSVIDSSINASRQRHGNGHDDRRPTGPWRPRPPSGLRQPCAQRLGHLAPPLILRCHHPLRERRPIRAEANHHIRHRRPIAAGGAPLRHLDVHFALADASATPRTPASRAIGLPAALGNRPLRRGERPSDPRSNQFLEHAADGSPA